VVIYLLRASLVADDHRGLSLEGRRLVREMGNRLRLGEEPSFDRVFTSDLPSAIQTAELFSDRVDHVGIVDVLPGLAGRVPPQVLAPTLLGAGQSIMVVGDEPALSELGAFLVSRPTFPPLMPAQVSVIRDRQPAWCFRPGEVGRALLLVA
jgi:phosphohistidine phosphatase SixA